MDLQVGLSGAGWGKAVWPAMIPRSSAIPASVGHRHCPRCLRCLITSTICLEYHPAKVAKTAIPYEQNRTPQIAKNGKKDEIPLITVLEVPCPTCEALEGETCQSSGSAFHPLRRAVWKDKCFSLKRSALKG
jgi:hypothetical protein